VVRAAFLALALLLLAWLAVGYRDVELTDEGNAVLVRARDAPIAPDDLRRGQRALQDARLLSPSLTPLLDEGYLLAAAGRRAEALAIATRATAEEPENVDGWVLTYVTVGERERATVRRKIGELDPLILYGLR
jgi:hypothetical protein